MLFAFVALLSSAFASNYDTYPSVPHTASYNGFADPIYDKLPECAKSCVIISTSSTPCPYWDTGCLCVMPQWSGTVAECWAESCSGAELATATSLAYSLCSSVGADMWLMPASVSTDLSEAVGSYTLASATATSDASGSSSQAVTSGVSSTVASNSTMNGTSSSTTSASATSSTSAAGAGVVQTTGIAALVVLAFLALIQ